MTTSITTKNGDKGNTKLYSGEEVGKNDSKIKFVGLIDEVVSFLGLARVTSKKVSKELEQVQKDLFILASQVAINHSSVLHSIISSLDDIDYILKQDEYKKAYNSIMREYYDLEKIIDYNFIDNFEKEHNRVSSLVDFPKDFILPGGNNSVSGANIDIARAKVRNLETIWWDLEFLFSTRKPVDIYLNRLSDYLWLLARIEEGQSKMQKEVESKDALDCAHTFLMHEKSTQVGMDGKIYYKADLFNPKDYVKVGNPLIEAIYYNGKKVIKKMSLLDFVYDSFENNSEVVKYWRYADKLSGKEDESYDNMILDIEVPNINS
jgi:ATP:cob(I)alamin adenosyltransferase